MRVVRCGGPIFTMFLDMFNTWLHVYPYCNRVRGSSMHVLRHFLNIDAVLT